jgi:hypothetical protein
MSSQTITPGTAVTKNFGFASRVWSSPSLAIGSDDAWAQTSNDPQYGTDYLVLSNFGATLPVGASITGFSVSIEAHGSGTSQQLAVYVSKTTSGNAPSTGASSLTTPNLASSDTIYTLGGSSTLWGQTWSRSDVQASTFSVWILPNFILNETYYIDDLSVTVYYAGLDLNAGVTASSSIQRQTLKFYQPVVTMVADVFHTQSMNLLSLEAVSTVTALAGKGFNRLFKNF